MNKKGKHKKSNKIDLSSRRNIKIIESESSHIFNKDIYELENILAQRSKWMEKFYMTFIDQSIKDTSKISDNEFDEIMKDLLKWHKILKNMIKLNNSN